MGKYKNLSAAFEILLEWVSIFYAFFNALKLFRCLGETNVKNLKNFYFFVFFVFILKLGMILLKFSWTNDLFIIFISIFNNKKKNQKFSREVLFWEYQYPPNLWTDNTSFLSSSNFFPNPPKPLLNLSYAYSKHYPNVLQDVRPQIRLHEPSSRTSGRGFFGTTWRNSTPFSRKTWGKNAVLR